MNEMLLRNVQQAMCDSIDICSDTELDISLSDSLVVCYDSNHGAYSVHNLSGPINAKIVEQPRNFSISLENGIILTLLTACENDQECPLAKLICQLPHLISPSPIPLLMSNILKTPRHCQSSL